MEFAADRTCARCDPLGRRQAHAEDDALGTSAALGEGRKDLLFDVQRPSGGVHDKTSVPGCMGPRSALFDRYGRIYEWKKLDPKGKDKQPYAIAMADAAPMVMAGLWARWNSPSGEEIQSCTILTCGTNSIMGKLHNRMPVIVAESDWPKWLGEEPATEEELLAMLKPCPDEALKIWPVDKRVGNVRNKGPQLATPV